MYFEKVFKSIILKDNMKKEVRNYLSIGFLVLAVLVLAYLLNLGITGFAVLPEEYENQTDCEDAGYIWEDVINETCSEIVGCEVGVTGCVDTCEECVDEVTGQECSDLNYTTQIDCETAKETWDDIIEQNCTTIPDCEVGVTGCVDTCEECVDEIIGGQCIGDVCDSEHLDLCLTLEDCGAAEGYWYDANEDGNSTCNAEEQLSCINTLTLCLDETNCTQVGGGHWYDDVCNAEEEPSCSNDLNLCDEANCVDVGNGYWYDDVCNANECASDDQCDSGYECDAGSCVEIKTPSLEKSLSSSEISVLSLNPGSSEENTMVVTNTGGVALVSCKMRPAGELSSWILVSEETTNISPGEQHEFSFDIAVPEETEEGSYSLRISTECSEVLTTRDFTVNVEEKKLEFEVISADRTRDDRVRVIYSLEELAGEEQDVVFIFSLVDANNIEVGRVKVNQSIDANSTDEFRTNIDINESLLPINETTNETLESELTLNVNFNSEIYSSSVMEKITIGAPIGGFAIFEGVGAGEAILFVVVLFVLVFIFVFARRMRRKGKTLKDVIGSIKPSNNPR